MPDDTTHGDNQKGNQTKRNHVLTDSLSPEFPKVWIWVIRAFIAAFAFYVLAQFCEYFSDICQFIGIASHLPMGINCTYIALGLILLLLLADRILRHECLEWQARLEDSANVRSTLIQAEQYLEQAKELKERYKEDGTDHDISNYLSQDADTKALRDEIDRISELGPEEWTEYEVLALNEAVVPFWDPLDLMESAREYLADLQDYAEDTKYRYEWKQVNEKQSRIDTTLNQLEEEYKKAEKVTPNNKIIRTLRSQVIGLIEHVTSYKNSWAVGSAMIRALTIYGCIASTILIFMGLMPLFYADSEDHLTILNWSVLGAAGALTGALRVLRQGEAVEIGNTEGKQEIRRCMLGVVLGLVAGVIIYSLISGGFLQGKLFPDLSVFNSQYESSSRQNGIINEIIINNGKAIFWSLAAGYSFEKLFDRLRGATSGFSS